MLRDNKILKHWSLPAIGALCCWGIWSFIPKIAMQNLPPGSALFYAGLGDVLAILPVYLFVLRGKLQKNRKGIGITFIASFLTMGSMLGYFYALDNGPVAVVATITAMYPVITVLLAYVFLQETINRKQFLAILMALVAIVLLAG